MVQDCVTRDPCLESVRGHKKEGFRPVKGWIEDPGRRFGLSRGGEFPKRSRR